MRSTFIVLCIFFFSGQIAHAQRFTQVSTGSIATTNLSSGGCSWADYNHDGYPDLYVSNTSTSNQLFKNNGDGTFQEVTTGGIVTDGGISNSAVWGDYDNDGNLDLFVSNNPPQNMSPQLNFLYKNNGPPTYGFTAVSTPATQTHANYTWSSSWVDYDNDGDLDLHMPDNKHLAKDYFYENNGMGGFTAVTPSFVTPLVESTGIASWIDYDHDGDQDLFMIKSGRSHFSGREDHRMYHNLLKETGTLSFSQVTTAAIVKHRDLDFQASWGDYDNDGDMDVYLGNFDNHNYLYRNNGDSLFTRMTFGPHVQENNATLGSTWADFDNDGDLDLYVLNTNLQASRYYENDGSGNFSTQLFSAIGPPVSNISAAQGCATADFNNDGYLDLFVANSFSAANARNYLYRNNGGSNHFIAITCEGTLSNAAAIGTKVWVKATINGVSRWQLRHITGCPTGNHSQDDLRVHVGLGDATTIDSIKIEWPLGLVETYTNAASDQFLTYVEGAMTGLQKPFPDGQGLTVFPNPVQDVLTYRLKGVPLGTRYTVSLLDVTGRIVDTAIAIVETLESNVSTMAIAKIPPGIYFLEVRTETQFQVVKVIKD